MNAREPYQSWLAPVLGRSFLAIEEELARDQQMREKRNEVAARSRMNRAERRAHERGDA